MSPVPMYEVIYGDLLSQIKAGALAPGDRLPSEPTLASQYGVSRMTVRQALDQLEAEHVVVRRRGSGTYVAQPSSTYRRMNRLGSFGEEMGVSEVSTEMKFQGAVVAPDEVRTRLGLKPRQKATRLLRVRLVSGSPAAVQESWLPYSLAPQLAREELVGGSLYRTLFERWGVKLKWAEQTISAVAADAERAGWLGVAQGSPLIWITRVAFADDGTPIELAHSWTRPEFPLLARLET
ncbi:GntR family transcriptional regulator [Nonomuraea purpurea]|uniref:GntR family transcriptional regulator n=1 Tax=Nonomuraea purpurea TaxID=1849276 RepID=A0ABV8G900_9ACTN